MASTSQPPSKRMRATSASQRPRDPSEELSQVANLVERRRLQNRISQRNYRNKIRDRLEALEALVDKTSKDSPPTSATPAAPRNDDGASTRKPQIGDRTEYYQQSIPTNSPGASTQQPYQWDDMQDLLGTPPTDFDAFGDYINPHANQDSLGEYNVGSASPNPFSSGPGVALPSPALTSPRCNPFDMQAETAKPDDLSLKRNLSHTSSNMTAEASPIASKIPPPPRNTPMPTMACPSSAPYSYPFVLGTPYIPLSPMAFPEMNADGSPNEKAVPVIPASGYSTPPMPTNNYFPPQQFVWVPVPVMGMPIQHPVNVSPKVEKEAESKDNMKL